MKNKMPGTVAPALAANSYELLCTAGFPMVYTRILTINEFVPGLTCRAEKEEKGDYYRSEISRGEYARTLALPAEIDEEKVKATFSNGILELKLPKLKQSKRKSISVD